MESVWCNGVLHKLRDIGVQYFAVNDYLGTADMGLMLVAY